MKIFATILLLLICCVDYAQTALQTTYPDTIYLDQNKKKTSSNDWVFYQIIKPAADGKFSSKIWWRNGSLASIGTYSAIEPKKIRDGHFTYFSKNGIKIRDCYFKENRLEGEELIGDTLGNIKIKSSFYEGKLNGHRIEFYPTGVIKRDEIYKDSVFISGQSYDEKGNEVKSIPQIVMPEFPQGENALLRFIYQNIRYPNVDMEADIAGRVIVSFIVDTDGTITNIGIKQSVSAAIDDEAKRVVKLLPKFRPGMKDGEPVRVQFDLPINFGLK